VGETVDADGIDPENGGSGLIRWCPGRGTAPMARPSGRGEVIAGGLVIRLLY
jgi:hypothetical protein